MLQSCQNIMFPSAKAGLSRLIPDWTQVKTVSSHWLAVKPSSAVLWFCTSILCWSAWTHRLNSGTPGCSSSGSSGGGEGTTWSSSGGRLAAVWFGSSSGTFWLNLNLKYQVQSSGQLNPEPEPLKLGLKGSNSVRTSSNLQLNKPNFSFFYLFSFSVFSWCHTVTEPNWLAYIFISSQPALSFHSHSHTTSKVIVFITN